MDMKTIIRYLLIAMTGLILASCAHHQAADSAYKGPNPDALPDELKEEFKPFQNKQFISTSTIIDKHEKYELEFSWQKIGTTLRVNSREKFGQ